MAIAPTVVVGVAALLAACGSTTPTNPVPPSTASPPASTASATAAVSGSSAPSAAAAASPSAIYASIETQVEQIRGLRPTGRQPVPTVVSPAGLAKIVAAELDKPATKTELAANEALLKGLGMLPAGASLADLEAKLLSSQVAGLYDPEAKQLYVVSKAGALGPTERVTFAHEFTHELQDQNFGLGSLRTDAIGQGDRDLARLALIEGDATDVMTIWSQQHLTPDELVQLAKDSSDPAAIATLAGMPSILRNTLTFPYGNGLSFVSGLQARGGWTAVDAAFRSPPDSTEQILHPEKFAAHERPLAGTLPAGLDRAMGSGWRVQLDDTLGEFQMRVWLRGAVPFSQALQAAAGWGGDRVELLDGPNDAWAIVLRTAWDSSTDAAEFAAASRAMAASLPHAAAIPADQSALVAPATQNGLLFLAASDQRALDGLRAALRLPPGT